MTSLLLRENRVERTGGICYTILMSRKKKASSLSFFGRHISFLQSFFYVVISVLAAYILFQTGAFHTFVHSLQNFGYIGVFISGMFFVSIFTTAPAAVILLTFAETLPVVLVAAVAGVGSVLGDAIILSFISDNIDKSVTLISGEKGVKKVIRLLRHTKYKFFLTVIGAIVVASPLPDELGLTLMGVSKIKPLTFIGISLVLNTLGIWVLLSILS